MRILQISSARNYGGGERHFIDLCREMQSRGNDIFLALRPTTQWQERVSFINPANILHVSIRNSFGILSANRIAGFIRENNIEIIHAHVARDYIPASIACALSKSAKFVLTRHVLFPLKPFNRFALKNLSRAIAVSASVRTSLQKVFPTQKIALIPNGIAPPTLSFGEREEIARTFRSQHNIPSDVPFIGIVGELIELKGQRDFILAANELAKKHPLAKFVVVGSDKTTDQQFRRELRRLTKVFGLQESFLWLDWVDDTDALYAALDILVSASHTESFGMTMLEAMASGTAVVATATGGAMELMTDHEKLVPVRDPLALAARICELLEDPTRRKTIAEAAQIYALEKFSLGRMVDETEKVYREILSNE